MFNPPDLASVIPAFHPFSQVSHCLGFMFKNLFKPNGEILRASLSSIQLVSHRAGCYTISTIKSHVGLYSFGEDAETNWVKYAETNCVKDAETNCVKDAETNNC